jgi:hypothetical protein
MPEGLIFMSKSETTALRILDELRMGKLSRSETASLSNCSERGCARRAA